jgi:DNA repair exonuclease SbcCD ATPase subunit
MRNVRAAVMAAMLVVAVSPPGARAADDPAVERARQMVRRTQEALRQAQAENAELVRAKADAEQKALAATKEIDAVKSGTRTAQQGLRAQIQAAQADHAQKMAAADAELSEAKEKQRVTQQLLVNRDAELKQTKQLLAQSTAANASCEDKNDQLYTWGQEVLDKYKNKGVWAAMAQREPVLRLKEVAIENTVQEYRLKMAGQKVKPATP